MVVSIGVKQPPNHPLVLSVVFARLGLEEVHAPLAQRDRDLYALLPKDQVLGTRNEVRNEHRWKLGPPDDDTAASREEDGASGPLDYNAKQWRRSRRAS